MSGLFEPADCRLDRGINAVCREEGVDGKKGSIKTLTVFRESICFCFKDTTMKTGVNGVNAMVVIAIH